MKISFKVNPIVKYLIFADLSVIGGWGFLTPILPVFIIQDIKGATLATVGVALGIHWLIRSLVHVPLGEILDRIKGEKDDFYALILSLILAGISSFAFLAVSEIWHLYLVMTISGLAFGVYVPAWRGIFSRHLDKERHAFDWSLSSTAIGLGVAAAAFLSGGIASWLGFYILFILMGLLSFFAIFLVMAIPEILLPRRTSKKESAIQGNHHSPKGI